MVQLNATNERNETEKGLGFMQIELFNLNCLLNYFIPPRKIWWQDNLPGRYVFEVRNRKPFIPVKKKLQ